MTIKDTPEYQAYQELKHWKPVKRLPAAKELMDPKSPAFPLFLHLYNEAKEVYLKLPMRKNGEHPFIHPANVVLALREAGVTDEATLMSGLVHDFIEEKVDLYKKANKLAKQKEHLLMLDQYEEKASKEFQEDMEKVCRQKKINTKIAAEVLTITRLLTRHKRDFYYKSIAQVYQFPDDIIKEKAIQVKLADRMHNVLTIETFNNQQRIYGCFKNLFILNNTKKFLIDRYGDHMTIAKKLNPTEVLFKRSAKATYEAFLTICHRCLAMGIGDVKAMIQLAFKKYAMEKEAVWKITKSDEKEMHLMRLFHGVVRKYDGRLHHEWERFEDQKKAEFEYCQKFFADYEFNGEQIQAVLDYKDAYALKEVAAYLLYLPKYFVAQFLSSELTKTGRIKR
ncbi:hypothetical protein COV20_00585 [Candidatus Woesearchaeota archaeon CG10_big_fil_rev_8_21_14_0_10_45_16]|nr:MAG: hypothetical protein COV20_00585 [Candidatus Woesearchaeota archaeon CG10_big_fil_rev_8_21_14_0_10_45_16]